MAQSLVQRSITETAIPLQYKICYKEKLPILMAEQFSTEAGPFEIEPVPSKAGDPVPTFQQHHANLMFRCLAEGHEFALRAPRADFRGRAAMSFEFEGCACRPKSNDEIAEERIDELQHNVEKLEGQVNRIARRWRATCDRISVITDAFHATEVLRAVAWRRSEKLEGLLRTSEHEKTMKERHLEKKYSETESLEIQLKMWKFLALILLVLLVAAGWWLGKDDQSCSARHVEELCFNFTTNLSEESEKLKSNLKACFDKQGA